MFRSKHVRSGQTTKHVKSRFPSENCHKKIPTRSPPPGGIPCARIALRLTTSVNQNIIEATNAAPIIFRDTPQVIFHPDVLEFSPNILTYEGGCPALLSSAGSNHAEQALTDTATPDTATPSAIGISKINSNHTQTT